MNAKVLRKNIRGELQRSNTEIKKEIELLLTSLKVMESVLELPIGVHIHQETITDTIVLDVAAAILAKSAVSRGKTIATKAMGEALAD